MSGLLGRLRYFASDALDEWCHSPAVNLLATATLAGVLFASGTVLVVLHNVEVQLERWRGDANVKIFLVDTATPEETESLRELVTAIPGVARTELVSKEEAARRFRESFGELARISESLDGNPLPASVEAFLEPGVGATDAARRVAEAVRDRPGVEDVRYEQEWLDRLDGMLGTARTLGAALAFVVLTAAIFVMASVLKLAVHARSEEVDTMLLVGASPAFVRGPFLVSGLAQGVVGAVVALVLTEGVRRLALAYAGDPPPEIARFLAGAPLSLELSLLVVLSGAAVGVLSSFFAVRTFERF